MGDFYDIISKDFNLKETSPLKCRCVSKIQGIYSNVHHFMR